MSDYETDGIESRLSYELTGVADSNAFFDATASMLGAIFKCDGVVWNHLDLARQTAFLRGTPAELENEDTGALLARYAADHPIIQSYIAEPTITPRRMSDVATRSELLRTGSYNEVMRPLGIHFQLSMMTTRSGQQTGGGWALSRELRDFTEEDVEIAARIQAMLSLLTYRETTAPYKSEQDARERSGLTNRELDVLRLVAQGHTARAIAGLLRIAPATVRKHLEHVYAKLGTSDRLLAVREGQKLGLLPVPVTSAIQRD